MRPAISRRDIAAYALKAMIWPKYRSGSYFWGWRSALLRDDDPDYVSVGDGSGNSIVSACVQWIARTFPEAPPALWEVDDEAVRTRLPRRDPRTRMLKVLRFPTSSPAMPRGFYSGVQLWMATLASWTVDGNAYWIKVRDTRPFRDGGPPAPPGTGAVRQLWYVPHWLMEPRWPDEDNGRTFISHYEMNLNGEIVKYLPQEVVHFRHGLDPSNVRKGLSPLHAVLREVANDEEAARFTAAVLQNMGFPGVVISPAENNSYRGSQTDVDAVKEKYKQTVTGRNRGEPLVFNSPTKLDSFGFSPQQLDLGALRDVPEERVTAALGVPAAVVGFGTGLQQTKVGATLAEYREQAWQSNLIPTQHAMGEEIAVQLMPDFALDSDELEFGFDLSRVAIFQDHMVKNSEAWTRLFTAGIATRREARSKFDLPSGPDDDIYVLPAGVLPVTDVDDQGPTAPNGNTPPTGTPADQLPEAQPAA